jgi:hypothetical protein
MKTGIMATKVAKAHRFKFSTRMLSEMPILLMLVILGFAMEHTRSFGSAALLLPPGRPSF